jgi:hypothetical protein
MSGLSSTKWFECAGLIIGSVLAACIFEQTLFLIIDTFWSGPEEVRLYAHCLNGPLGFVLALAGTKVGLQHNLILREFRDWKLYMSATLIVWCCYALKSFYHRRQFNMVLAAKFESRLVKMENQSKILSILASTSLARKLKGTFGSSFADQPIAVSPMSTSSPSSRNVLVNQSFFPEAPLVSESKREKALDTLKSKTNNN